MKIISKYKDYYDYLVGKYGCDEKLVLDRTRFYPTPDRYSSIVKIRLYVCDFEVEVLYMNGQYLCGEKIAIVSDGIRKKDSWYHHEEEDSYRVPHLNEYIHFRAGNYVKHSKDRPNTKLDCPILIQTQSKQYQVDKEYERFPILADYKISNVLEAERVWLLLTEWLGRDRIKPAVVSDKQKIISHGFDLIYSFRKM